MSCVSSAAAAPARRSSSSPASVATIACADRRAPARPSNACVYDRWGVGDGPATRRLLTARDHVADLHELITIAGLPQPLVMVGHSYGGLIALLEAVEHPDEVAAVVLIDASHPHDIERLQALMTEEQRKTFLDAVAATSSVDFSTSLAEAAAVYRRFPSMPLTVISADRSMTPWCEQGLPCEAMDAVHQELQDDYAALVPGARHAETETGHYVHDEEPTSWSTRPTRCSSTRQCNATPDLEGAAFVDHRGQLAESRGWWHPRPRHRPAHRHKCCPATPSSTA